MTLTTLTMTRAHDEAMGDEPSMPDRPRRRSFTADYKLEILTSTTVALATATRARLRREGLYANHIVEWRIAPGLRCARRPRPERQAAEKQPARRRARRRRRAERAEAELREDEDWW